MSKIISMGTAVPKYTYKQSDLSNFMATFCGLAEEDSKWLIKLNDHSEISYRHSVLPDFDSNSPSKELFEIGNNPSISERMACYFSHWQQLALSAVFQTRKSLSENNTSLEKVTHLITVSCTGVAAPGIDIELQKSLGLSADITRYAVNFMGCYAAFHAIKLADTIAKADSDALVLIVCVELCSLHFQPTKSKESLTANSLFADGAAAVVVASDSFDCPNALAINSFYSEVIPHTESDMSWKVNENGFLMTLSPQVPAQIKLTAPLLLEKASMKANIKSNDIKHWAIHPGGPKILQAFEVAMGLSKTDLEASYQVLSQNGNMSSPTIIFVLQEIWKKLNPQNQGERIFAAGFGPGLTVETAFFTKI